MHRSIRATASALGAALVVSSLLVSPILAAKPTTGGGGGTGGGTTSTAFAGTFSATPATTIVIGAPTRIAFKAQWSNGANRTFRFAIPTSYTKPYTGDPVYDADTGVGVGYVARSAESGTCGTAGLSTSDYTVVVTTADCSSGSFSFDYIGATTSTGSAKVPVYVDATTVTTTAFATLSLNSSSVRVALTGITRAGSPITAASAGDVVRFTFNVTDTKNRAVAGVPLTITDTRRSVYQGGSIACPHDGTMIVVCSASTGTAWVDLRMEGAGSHSVAGSVGNATAKKSLAVATGALDTLTLTAAEGELALGEIRTLSASAIDAYQNPIALTTAGTVFSDTGDGDVSFGPESVAAGVVSVDATGEATGDVTVSVTAGGKTESTAFTVVTGDIASLVLAGGSADLAAGDPRTYTLGALNAFGRSLAITSGDVDWTTGAADTGTLTYGEDYDSADGTVSLAVTGDVAGAVSLEATIAAAALTESTSFTVVPGAIATVTFSASAEGDLTAGDTRYFTVAAFDDHDNAIALTSGDVDWTTGLADTGTLAFTTPSELSDGSIRLVVTGDLTGGVTVQATLGTFTDQTTFTVVAGAYAALAIVGDDTEFAAGTTRTLTVVAMDSRGNVLSLDGLGLTLEVTSSDTNVLTTDTVNADGSFVVTAVTDGTAALGVSDGTVSSDPFSLTVPVPTPTPAPQE